MFSVLSVRYVSEGTIFFLKSSVKEYLCSTIEELGSDHLKVHFTLDSKGYKIE